LRPTWIWGKNRKEKKNNFPTYLPDLRLPERLRGNKRYFGCGLRRNVSYSLWMLHFKTIYMYTLFCTLLLARPRVKFAVLFINIDFHWWPDKFQKQYVLYTCIEFSHICTLHTYFTVTCCIHCNIFHITYWRDNFCYILRENNHISGDAICFAQITKGCSAFAGCLCGAFVFFWWTKWLVIRTKYLLFF